eukprot:g2764.t1
MATPECKVTRVVRCENVPVGDRSTSDPFVELRVRDAKDEQKKKTSTKKATLNPSYDESFVFSFPTRKEADEAVVDVVVKDWDCISRNDVLCTASLGHFGSKNGMRVLELKGKKNDSDKKSSSKIWIHVKTSYTVVLHVLKAKVPACDTHLIGKSSSDPFVVVRCGDEVEHKTRTVKRTLTPEWNESFEIHFEDEQAAEKATCSMTVFDWDRFTKNDKIGSAEIASLVSGSAVRTVQLLGAKTDDSTIDIRLERLSSSTDASGESKRQEGNEVEMPTIQTVDSRCVTTITILRAANLPACDPSLTKKRGSDPFVQLRCGDQKHRTKVKKNTLSPTFGEAFVFTFPDRSSCEAAEISIDVVDWDRFTSNDPMAGATLRNFASHDGEHILELENRSTSSTASGGKLWLHVRTSVTLTVDVLSAENLPAADVMNRNSDPYCVLECGDVTYRTKTVKATLDPLWRETFEFHFASRQACADAEIRLKLMDWDRLTRDDLIGEAILSKDFLTRFSKRDIPISLACGKKHAGVAKILVRTRVDPRDPADEDASSKTPSETEVRPTVRPDFFVSDKCVTTVEILRAANLPACDPSLRKKRGSDPFVKLQCGDQKYRTKVKKNTLNPTFNERFQFTFDNRAACEAAAISIDVIDWDRFTRNDTMSRCLLKDFSRVNGEQMIPLDDGKGTLFIRVHTSPTLKVRVVGAENLPAMDRPLLGKNSSDPYVRLECGPVRYRTKTVKKSLHPRWEEDDAFEFHFANLEALEDAKIRMDLLDYDKFTSFRRNDC